MLAWRMTQFPPRALAFLVCLRSVAEIGPSPLAAFGDAVAKIRQAGDHLYHSSRASVGHCHTFAHTAKNTPA